MLAMTRDINENYSRELSALALDAAIESEDLMSGAAQSSEAIDLFVSRIQESIVGSKGNKSLTDVTLIPIYHRALTSTMDQHFEDTRTLIDTLSMVLSRVKIKDENNQVSPTYFRDFCLAMYNALVSTAIASRDNTVNPGMR